MKWCVELIEYERGWGSRLDDRVYFDNKEAAEQYRDGFNSKNVEPTVPDWYMAANDPYEVKSV